MRILIASDAWSPQTNGVVTTLEKTITCLEAAGHNVLVVSPADFKTFHNPFYPEAAFVAPQFRKLHKMVKDFDPEYIHISVEGPLGWSLKAYCFYRGWQYTTAYHTKFPEYAHHLAGVPVCLGRAYVKAFHSGSACVMVATDSLAEELRSYGIKKLGMWRRGVDSSLFRPQTRNTRKYPIDKGPIAMYVGRVSKEKNIDAFLSAPNTDVPFQKYVVGGGPDEERLKALYPDAVFTGPKYGDELAEAFANADVFVFPSKTDTFGLVIIEAMACGVPVAAYRVTGPKDIIMHGETGHMSPDLAYSMRQAFLWVSRERCREAALGFSWESCTSEFVANLVRIKPCSIGPSSSQIST